MSFPDEALSARWWTHPVGALRVDPHEHAKYPPRKDRGPAQFGRVSRSVNANQSHEVVRVIGASCAVVIFIAYGLAASYIPARRATRMALR